MDANVKSDIRPSLRLLASVLNNLVFSVQVVDATNTTRRRREILVDMFTVKRNFKLFFVESVCEEPRIIEANILVSH